MVFLLTFCNITPCFCVTKENANNVGQNSKAKTTTAEKNTNKNNTKTETQKKDDKSPKKKTESDENTNETENDNKNEESQKENSEENTTKSKSSVPKMNSILPEKSSGEQTKENGSENKEKEFSEVEFNLPQVDDSEVAETSNIPTPESISEPRDIQKTIFAWIMICVGVAIILATIIINLKIPQGNMHSRYHEKHGVKSNKNKYRLKYK